MTSITITALPDGRKLREPLKVPVTSSSDEGGTVFSATRDDLGMHCYSAAGYCDLCDQVASDVAFIVRHYLDADPSTLAPDAQELRGRWLALLAT